MPLHRVPAGLIRVERLCCAALALALVPAVAHAADVEVSPGEDLAAVVNALQPGDVLTMRGGMYELSGRFGINLVATADAPIVIQAARGETPHVHREGTDQNLVDFDNAEYLTIRGIEFSGGSAGLRFSNARFVTLEGNDVHDTGDVAIRANDTGIVYEGFQILRNDVHHTNSTGEGMYLGCNDNGCQFTGALIEGNHVHHTNQASVEQGDGIEIKEGSSDNIIRDNVIHDTNYPCILTYANAGNGGQNIIERNVMWNCGDHGIQVAADAIIRNNIILSAGSNGIAMQSHQSGAPANLVVSHNTVLRSGDHAVRLGDVVGSVVLANNALYSESGNAIFFAGGDAAMVTVVGNVGQGGISGLDGTLGAGDLAADFISATFAGMPPIDVFPAPGGALIGAGDAAYQADDDVNCLARASADVGAYGAGTPTNPGWVISEGFKVCADGGSGGESTGGDESGTEGGSASASAGDASGDATADDSGSASGGPASGASASSEPTGGDTGTAGVDDDGGDKGCGCTQRPATGAAWSLVLLGLVLRRRRP